MQSLLQRGLVLERSNPTSSPCEGRGVELESLREGLEEELEGKLAGPKKLRNEISSRCCDQLSCFSSLFVDPSEVHWSPESAFPFPRRSREGDPRLEGSNTPDDWQGRCGVAVAHAMQIASVCELILFRQAHRQKGSTLLLRAKWQA